MRPLATTAAAQTAPAPTDTIVLGIDESYAPFEYLDGSGQPAGLVAELARAAAREAGLELRITAAQASTLRQLQTEDAIQVVSLPQAAAQGLGMAYTTPHTLLAYVAVVRQSEAAGHVAAPFDGLRVVAPQADAAIDALARTGVAVAGAASPVDALRQVADGQQDVAVLDRQVALYGLRQAGLRGLVSVGQPLQQGDRVFGAARRHADAIARLDRALHALQLSGESDRLRDRWLRVAEPDRAAERRTPGLLGHWLAPLLVAAVLGLAWSWALGVAVARRTHELRESEQRFRALFEDSADASLLLADGRFIDGNQAAADMLGLSGRDQVIGRSPADISPPQQAGGVGSDELAQRYLDAAAQNGSLRFEWLHRRPDGAVFPVEVTLTSIAVAGRPAFSVVWRDVSERKRAEAALLESEQRFRGLAEHSLDTIMLFDRDLRHLYVNPNAEAQSGLAASDFIGKTHEELGFPQDLCELWAQALRQVFDTGETGRMEFQLPSGPWVDWLLVPLKGADGTVEQVITSARDISDRKAAEVELRRSREMLQIFLDNTYDAVFVHDLDGRILDVNATMLAMYHLTREEALACTIADLTGPESSIATAMERWQHVLAGETLLFPWQARRPGDGSLFDVDVYLTRVTVAGVDHVLANVRDVTERKRYEEQLRLTEHSLDHCGVTFFWLDREGRILRTNQAASEILGYTREELQSMSVPDLDPLFPIDQFHAIFDEIKRRGHLVFETVHRRRDGTEFPVEVTSSHITYGSREVNMSFARDITERKRAEEAVRRTEERLARVNARVLSLGTDYLDNVNQLVALAGEVLQGAFAIYHRVEAGQPQAVAAWQAAGDGQPRPDLAGQLCCDVLRRVDGDVLQVVDLASSTYAGSDPSVTLLGAVAYLGHVVRGPSGHDIGALGVYFADVRPGEDADQQILGIIAAALESEEARRAAEAELRRLASAMDQAAEGVVITDHRGVIEYVNPAFERISGFTSRALVGQSSRCLDPVAGSPLSGDEVWAEVGAGASWSGRLALQRANGSTYDADVGISPVRDERGQVLHFAAVVRDVSKEVELEAQLRQSQKMEAVGLLAGGVAHDLNNLLAPILGYSEMLLDGDLDRECRSDIQQIALAAERARDLIKQLMAFGRKQPLEVVLLDLNEVVTDFVRLLRRTLREEIHINVGLGAGLGTIRADRTQVEQVLMNLAVNAQDAMAGGGTLSVETALVELDDGYVADHPDVAPGEYVMLAVSDSGTGMDAATVGRIFEPFFTTKERGKGTGLGLATVFGITKQHGGHISVYSEPGQGTTFRVYLPVVTDVETAPLAPGPEKVVGGSETVLVAEDDETVRDMACAMLRRLGYQVLTAETPEDCLAVGLAQPDRIDLLLTDVIMPGLSGRQLHEQLAEAIPDLKVVYMSGYTADVIADRYVSTPGIEIIAKPFTRQSLAAKLRHALEG